MLTRSQVIEIRQSQQPAAYLAWQYSVHVQTIHAVRDGRIRGVEEVTPDWEVYAELQKLCTSDDDEELLWQLAIRGHMHRFHELRRRARPQHKELVKEPVYIHDFSDDFELPQIVRLHRQGMTLREIAARVGFSHMTVKRFLQNYVTKEL